jgi:hypothetical protein
MRVAVFGFDEFRQEGYFLYPPVFQTVIVGACPTKTHLIRRKKIDIATDPEVQLKDNHPPATYSRLTTF